MILARHAVETSAAPGALWALIEQVGRWPEWDRSLGAAFLKGPLAVGSKVRLDSTPRFPKEFTLAGLEAPSRLVLESRLPGAVLRRAILVEPSPLGARLTLLLELQGPLAWLQALSLGRRLGAPLPAAARALARSAARPPQD